MPPEKRYTEEEARAIFKRAAERHEEARRAEEASRAGLTLEELQHIGAEAGIDPEHIASAASADLTRSGAPKQVATFLGLPRSIRMSRMIPGAMTDEGWEKIVSELRQTFGTDGIPGQVGRVRTWHRPQSPMGSSAGPLGVTLRPETGGTRVEIEQSMKDGVLGVLAGLFSAIFLSVIAVVLGQARPQMIALVGALLVGASWGGMRVYSRAKEKKFENALDRIELISRKSLKQDRTSAREAKTHPQVDLDALPDAPQEEHEGTSVEREREQ